MSMRPATVEEYLKQLTILSILNLLAGLVGLSVHTPIIHGAAPWMILWGIPITFVLAVSWATMSEKALGNRRRTSKLTIGLSVIFATVLILALVLVLVGLSGFRPGY